MNYLFRSLGDPDIHVDSDDSRSKHDSLLLRSKRDGFSVGHRRVFITCRVLLDWLVSDWNFKRQRMGIHDLPFDPVKYGLFYSLRLGGKWVPADYWLHYFAIDERFCTLRLSHICEDINNHLLPLIAGSMRFSEGLPILNESRKTSHRDYCFSREEIGMIYQQNPLWADWESKSYGS